jgi:hypothetical protein
MSPYYAANCLPVDATNHSTISFSEFSADIATVKNTKSATNPATIHLTIGRADNTTHDASINVPFSTADSSAHWRSFIATNCAAIFLPFCVTELNS